MNNATLTLEDLDLQAPGQTIIDAERFRARFELSKQSLAALARVHRTTVSDAPGNEKLQRMMRDSLRVLSGARALTGDTTRAIYWMRNTPIAEFDHQVALELVAAGKTDAVLRYLRSIESGASG